MRKRAPRKGFRKDDAMTTLLMRDNKGDAGRDLEGLRALGSEVPERAATASAIPFTRAAWIHPRRQAYAGCIR